MKAPALSRRGLRHRSPERGIDVQNTRTSHANLEQRLEPIPSSLGSGPSINALLRALGPVIYFVRTWDGVVKIGFTTNLDARRNNLGIRVDMILAWMPGTLDLEQSLHSRLVRHRARGREYYRPRPEILDEVNYVRTHLGLDPVGPEHFRSPA